MVNSVSLAASARGLLKIFKVFAVFLLASEEIQTEAQLRYVLFALLLGGAIASADGLLQWVIGIDPIYRRPMEGQLEGLRRVAGPYHHPNDFGLFLTFVLPLSLAIARVGRAWRLRGLAWITSLLVAVSLVLTLSRGAALGFVVAFLVMVLVWKAWRWLAGFVLVGIVVLALLPLSVKSWVLAQPTVWQVVLESETPQGSRPAIWRVARHMISSHPWVGVGVNTFVLNYERYRRPEDQFLNSPYAHNHYLQMLAEIGIVGFAIFVALLGIGCRRALQAYRAASDSVRGIALGLGLGLLAFLINGLTESALYYPRLATVFWLGFGMLFSAPFDGGTRKRVAA
jgi:O-antigen ligase